MTPKQKTITAPEMSNTDALNQMIGELNAAESKVSDIRKSLDEAEKAVKSAETLQAATQARQAAARLTAELESAQDALRSMQADFSRFGPALRQKSNSEIVALLKSEFNQSISEADENIRQAGAAFMAAMDARCRLDAEVGLRLQELAPAHSMLCLPAPSGIPTRTGQCEVIRQKIKIFLD